MYVMYSYLNNPSCRSKSDNPQNFRKEKREASGDAIFARARKASSAVQLATLSPVHARARSFRFRTGDERSNSVKTKNQQQEQRTNGGAVAAARRSKRQFL